MGCATYLLDPQGMGPAYYILPIGYIFIQSTALEQPLATALPRPCLLKHFTSPTGFGQGCDLGRAKAEAVEVPYLIHGKCFTPLTGLGHMTILVYD